MSDNKYCETCIHYDTCEDGYCGNTCGLYRNNKLMAAHIDFEDYEFTLSLLDEALKEVMSMRKSSKRDRLDYLINQALKILKGEFTLKCD